MDQTNKSRKRLRTERAAIHRAMDESRKMKRSKKKGTANLDANMVSLGFERIGPDGTGLPVEKKWRQVSP